MRLLPESQNSPSALSFGADDALSIGAMRAIVTFDAPFGSREPNYIAEIPPGDLKPVGPTPEAIDGPWLPTFGTIKYSPGGSRLAIGIDLLSRDYYIGKAAGDVDRLLKLASLKIGMFARRGSLQKIRCPMTCPGTWIGIAMEHCWRS